MTEGTRLYSQLPHALMAVLGAVVLVAALAGCAGAGVKTGQYVDDSTITTKVRTALLGAENLTSTGISVSTRNGEVQLSGHTRSETEKRRAENLAKDVEGVKSVTSDIQVKSN